MGSLDKLTLNNEIILMRPKIKNAKFHTISKIIQSIRQLKKKNGTEEQKEKNRRKTDRLIEEIKMIKTLKADEIAKFMLNNKEDPLTILSKGENDLKVKSLAKVCINNKLLKDIFNEFQKKYPNWLSEVPILLPQLGKRVKKKKKSQNLKERGSIMPNKKVLGNRNVEKTNYSSVVNTPGNNGFLVESKKENKTGMSILDSAEKRPHEGKNIYDGNKHEKKINPATVINERCEKKEKYKADKKKNNFESNENEKAINCNTVAKKIRKKENNVANNSEKKMVDPFFMTADNTEYITLVTNEKQAEVLRNTNLNSTNKTENFNFLKSDIDDKFSAKKFSGRSKNYFSNKKFETSNFGINKDVIKHENNGFDKKIKSNFTKNNFSKHKIERSNQSLSFSGAKNTEEKLHPSWEAKKKQSGLVEFSGKKIVFNND